MKVHQAMARALRDHGVETIFGLNGNVNMFLVQSFLEEEKSRYVGAVHEAGAMFISVGYACVARRLAVVTLPRGPALVNTLTGLAVAARGRIPMLLIVGDSPVVNGHQPDGVDERDFITPTGAGFELARTPATVLDDLSVAIRRARVESRPVVFDVPSSLQWADVTYERVQLDGNAPPQMPPDPVDLEQMVRSAVPDLPVPTGRRAVMSGLWRTTMPSPPVGAETVAGGRTLDVGMALRHLDERLPQNCLVVTDGGRFMMEPLRQIAARVPLTFVHPENFGSIGTGMSTAVGAALVDPARTTVLVCSARGLVHGGLAEFATAVREHLDMIVVVCNDAGHAQPSDAGLASDRPLFAWPDLAVTARALGGGAVTVHGREDLARASTAIDERDRPLLIDLRLGAARTQPMPHTNSRHAGAGGER